MKKQLRILFGDIGDDYATGSAAAFCEAGDWAITREQQPEMLLLTIRHEHPDVLILNQTRPMPRFPETIAEVLSHTAMVVLVLYRVRCSGMEQILMQRGAHYLPFPKSHEELIALVHRLSGRKNNTVQKTMQKQDPDIAVTRLLHSFGISANLCGFHYLRRAILFAYESGLSSGCMMNVIYPAVAESAHSTPARVERSIRHAIMQAWENANHQAGWLYGIRENRRMINSEFIAFAVDWLRTEHAARQQYQ